MNVIRGVRSWLALLTVAVICAFTANAQASPASPDRAAPVAAITASPSAPLAQTGVIAAQPAQAILAEPIAVADTADPQAHSWTAVQQAWTLDEPAASIRQHRRLTAHGLDDHLSTGAILGSATFTTGLASVHLLC